VLLAFVASGRQQPGDAISTTLALNRFCCSRTARLSAGYSRRIRRRGDSEKLIPEKFARMMRPQIKAARSIAQNG
jgi:hypothetical protein